MEVKWLFSEKERTARSLRDQGLTLQAISERLGVTRQRVHQLLRRAEATENDLRLAPQAAREVEALERCLQGLEASRLPSAEDLAGITSRVGRQRIRRELAKLLPRLFAGWVEESWWAGGDDQSPALNRVVRRYLARRDRSKTRSRST